MSVLFLFYNIAAPERIVHPVISHTPKSSPVIGYASLINGQHSILSPGQGDIGAYALDTHSTYDSHINEPATISI